MTNDRMTWTEALESLALNAHVERYRRLCADSNADAESREAYRNLVVRKASGESKAQYPPAAIQLKSALSAIGGIAVAAIKGEPIAVGDEDAARRLAICRSNTCGLYVAAEGRCKQCGCFTAYKTRLATEDGHCPVHLW
jgi:hypothetical protein